MLAMHYAFDFPDDFDMTRIRRRVAEKGPLFDSYPGLMQKAFLINDVKTEILGDEVGNSYAAFYVWQSNEAAGEFLLSDAFAAVSAAFGRPRVRSWQVLAFQSRPDMVPRHALMAGESLRTNGPGGLADVARNGAAAAGLAAPGLQSSVLALDPYRWELLRFSLWRSAADAEGARNGNSHGYEVLHLSAPAAESVGPPSIPRETPIAEIAQLRAAYQ